MVDRPAIQYVVEEAVAAGLSDILMVTGRNKTPLENHFDRVLELEIELEHRGDTAKLESVRHASSLADVHYLRQGAPLGLGHAVHRAAQHVGNEAFAVLLGDDIISTGGTLLREMIRIHEETGASVVAVQQVPREHVSSYGVVAPQLVRGEFAPAGEARWPTWWVDTLVEKPAVEDAPSNLAIIGRYVLRPEAFDILARTKPGRGGEIQLTDALVELAAHRRETGGVVAMVYGDRRYDTGNKLDYLKANVELALASAELGPQLREWLVAYTAKLASSETGSSDTAQSEAGPDAGRDAGRGKA